MPETVSINSLNVLAQLCQLIQKPAQGRLRQFSFNFLAIFSVRVGFVVSLDVDIYGILICKIDASQNILFYLFSFFFAGDFIYKVSSQSPTRHFIIHSRKALLNGISPADNRRIPPLKYVVPWFFGCIVSFKIISSLFHSKRIDQN